LQGLGGEVQKLSNYGAGADDNVSRNDFVKAGRKSGHRLWKRFFGKLLHFAGRKVQNTTFD
jgi:hypothetical protein